MNYEELPVGRFFEVNEDNQPLNGSLEVANSNDIFYYDKERNGQCTHSSMLAMTYNEAIAAFEDSNLIPVTKTG